MFTEISLDTGDPGMFYGLTFWNCTSESRITLCWV